MTKNKPQSMSWQANGAGQGNTTIPCRTRLTRNADKLTESKFNLDRVLNLAERGGLYLFNEHLG